MFEALHASGGDKYFHPHPFTAEEATARANYKGKDIYAVATDGQRILAYGMLRGWDAGFDIPSIGLGVDPTAQGRGHGRLLMEWLHYAAKERGAKKIRLKVYAENARGMKMDRLAGYKFDDTMENGQYLAFLDLTTLPPKP